MKSIAVQEAVGLILCHDITEIVAGQHKKTAFRKGHVVRAEDVEHLLRLGKEHLYVWSDEPEGWLHENDAAHRLAQAIGGPGTCFSEVREGRINLSAAYQGLVKINVDLLYQVNSIPDVTVATVHNMRQAEPGQPLAGTRVVPLCVKESAVQQVEELCRLHGPLVNVLPFKKYKGAIITTGSEVFHGRIKDGFGPVLEKKFADWGVEKVFHTFVPDETEQTVTAIQEALAQGATLITVTGGMSVDPDDKTPAAIKAVADDIVSYGAPVYPGAMFMLAYKGEVPIMGLPGCVMFNKATIFDLIVPRLLAGLKVNREDLLHLSHGGLCESCPDCHYPNCVFGK